MRQQRSTGFLFESCWCAASILLIVLATVPAAVAQAPTAQRPMATDRPGFGYAATVLDPGVVQIEVGTPALEQNAYDVREGWELTFPALLRVGVRRGLELRISSPVYHLRRFDDEQYDGIDGAGDVTLGAKMALPVWEPYFVTDVAVLPRVTLPLGEAAFTSDRVGAELNAIGGWLGWWTLSFSTLSGIALRPVGGDYRLVGQFAVSMSHSPVAWLSFFVESGYFPRSEAAGPLYAGAGFTASITPDVQLDAYVDGGLNDAAVDLLYGLGFSVRFD